MDTLTARPQLLKQANLSLLRKALRARGTATRAELAADTRISATTVRSLLTELLQSGEVMRVRCDESSGGRKPGRYGFNPGRCCCAAFCITGGELHGLLLNARGDILECRPLEAPGGDFERPITAFLDSLAEPGRLRSIGVGVPGVVDGGAFWRADPRSGELLKTDLGDRLAARYGVPVVLENDINATAVGFGLCYEREFPGEGPENTNMAYLHFEKGCVSAGLIAGGRVLRGCKHFAGELGLVPMGDGRPLDAWMAEAEDDRAYSRLVATAVGWVCGILNPQYVALGGPALRKGCIGPIGDGLSALLPPPLCPELLYAPDVWHDYHSGMAHLTVEKMFEHVQFIRE